MKKTIVLFQQDLRLADNPALTDAAQNGEVIPVYVLDESIEMGGASKWWLHHSLLSLQQNLKKAGVNLVVKKGDTNKIIFDLAKQTKAEAVYWNRCYEPQNIEKGKKLKLSLEAENIEAKSFNANLLFEPWEIVNQQGTYFKVFTPFWKNCLIHTAKIEDSLPAPVLIKSSENYHSDNLPDLKLLPSKPDWSGGLQKTWQVGEEAAQRKLHNFLEKHVKHYPDKRNIPADAGTSYLSPHLHFGEISPRQIWHASRHYEACEGHGSATEKFLSEVGWREFSYYLLYHSPSLPNEAFNQKFNRFPWENDSKSLNAWQKGLTGYPIVDAGMRELWHTGYMHNRVRMIVASFLTKHLLIHWKEGADWFFDTLVDADLANNSASWQWVAGCGADAAPYYRIFNPILQGTKFDPEGAYVKRWLPELSKLPPEFIHRPWEANEKILKYAGVMLGETYPKPIVNHTEARDKAMQLYKGMN